MVGWRNERPWGERLHVHRGQDRTVLCGKSNLLSHQKGPASASRAPSLQGLPPVVRLVKNPAMQETWGSIPGLGRSPGEGKGYPLQYSGLQNSMDCIVHGVTKSRTRMNDFHFTFSLEWADTTESPGRSTCVKRVKPGSRTRREGCGNLVQ